MRIWDGIIENFQGPKRTMLKFSNAPYPPPPPSILYQFCPTHGASKKFRAASISPLHRLYTHGASKKFRAASISPFRRFVMLSKFSLIGKIFSQMVLTFNQSNFKNKRYGHRNFIHSLSDPYGKWLSSCRKPHSRFLAHESLNCCKPRTRAFVYE